MRLEHWQLKISVPVKSSFRSYCGQRVGEEEGLCLNMSETERLYGEEGGETKGMGEKHLGNEAESAGNKQRSSFNRGWMAPCARLEEGWRGQPTIQGEMEARSYHHLLLCSCLSSPQL